MRSKGVNGRLDESHPKPTRDQFVSNYRSLEVAEKQLYQSANNPKRKEELLLQVTNLKGILIRQLTTHIYKEPSTGYLHKLQEFKSIAAELSKLTGEHYASGAEDEINVTFSTLMTDLKTGQ